MAIKYCILGKMNILTNTSYSIDIGNKLDRILEAGGVLMREKKMKRKKRVEESPIMDGGCWIMLTKKLPTEPYPPKLSLFWSVPWINMKHVRLQLRRMLSEGDIRKRYLPETLSEEVAESVFNDRDYSSASDKEVVDIIAVYGGLIQSHFGSEPNWALARKIIYKGEEIRVFSHEYSIPRHCSLIELVTGHNGIDPSHDLVTGTVAEYNLDDSVINGINRIIYDAALVDGCNEAQAKLMANGVDVSDKYEIPALGWYRCKKEYASMYCRDNEMEEV